MKLPTPSPAWATLCSPERVYRVESDRQGKFLFSKVLPESYDLVIATRSYEPELITKVTLNDDQKIGPITALVHWGNGKNPCYVSTQHENLLRDFEVDYSDPDIRRNPVIKGSALRTVYDRNQQKPPRLKPLPKAQIQLYRAGGTDAVLTTETDTEGNFELRPEPGIYELAMTQSGYYEVRTSPFLVPRENITEIELRTAPEGSVVLRK